MRVRIVSDGTRQGTEVVDTETGEPLSFVTAVEWRIVAGRDGLAEATIHLSLVPVELTVEAEVEGESNGN